VTIGQIARHVLGDRWFPVVGAMYRALVVDIDKVVDAIPAPKVNDVILDIGGGDGAVLDRYLARYPDARAIMLDLSPKIGIALSPDRKARVELFSSTSIADFAKLDRPKPTLLLVSDVIHHVSPPERPQFFADVRSLLANAPARLVIKDVEPGSVRAVISLLGDRFVSGDRNVSLIGKAEMMRLVLETFARATCEETVLLNRDPPNYCLVFAV
jgi:methyltransferase family protein